MSGTPILAIERDPSVLDFIRLAVSSLGAELVAAGEPGDAIARAHARLPRAIVVSLELDGFALSLVRRFRSDLTTSRVPIILLASPGMEMEIAAGLEEGASDYLILPVEEGELAERLSRVLDWKPMAGMDRVVSAGPVEMDVERRAVLRPVLVETLTPCEFEMLRWMAATPGRAFTRRQLVAADRAAYPPAAPARAVDRKVESLRRKLGRHSGWIETLPGVGYRFSDPEKKRRDSGILA